jgi:hypothetical protein
MRVLLSLLAMSLLPMGCADGAPADDSGSLVLGLQDSVSGWFHVKIYEEAPAFPGDNPKVVFETGCIDAKSRTYELNNIPTGDDLVVEIASFGSAECSPESQAEIGYRGLVDISSGKKAPYYHVPIFEHGASTAFPEDINISASVAEAIDFCDSDSQCADFSSKHVCYDGQSPAYWCVPSCETKADCEGYHPRATCDVETRWCVLRSPYPLNLASPRAMGHATTLKNGSVAFLAGFGSTANGRFVANSQVVETFDVATGLFRKDDIAGLDGWSAAMTGLATLPDGRAILVGGVRSAKMGYQVKADGSVDITVGDLTEKDCSTEPCLPNIRNELVVIDLESRKASIHEMPLPVASPTVLSLGKGRVLIAGGIAPAFGGIGGAPAATGNVATDRVWIAQIGSGTEVVIKEVGTMTVPRLGAAALCQNDACDSVLLIGGNREGSVAEVMSLSGEEPLFIPVAIQGLPQKIGGPSVCNGDLVGGTAPGLKTMSLDPVDGNWTSAPLENGDVATALLSATAVTASGDCWVVGGLANGEATGLAFRVSGDAVAPKTYTAESARFGAMAAQIGAGLLDEGLLFAGGFRLAPTDGDSGSLEWVRGAEVLLP